MILFPSLEIRHGYSLPFLKGGAENRDPVELARSFEALGFPWLHLIDIDAQNGKGLNPSEYVTLFTDVEMEFFKPVHAGEKVRVQGEKQSWRFRKIRSKAALYNEQGELIAQGTLSGMGVKKQ